jgi:NitT/TauT family transport system substrate-binding protein
VISARPGGVSALPVLLVVGLLLAACGANQQGPGSAAGVGPSADGSAAPTHLVLSYSNLTPDQWALWIAQDLGVFSRHGLDVDLRLIESSTGVAALIAGETQAGAMGGSEVMSAAAEGAELSIVGSLVKTFSFRFMAPESVQTIGDLRGKRVGVSRFGSSSDIATRLALENLGLVANRDLEIVQVGSLTARIQAMESGAIQGGVVQPPDTARVAKSGYHVVFDVSDLGIPAATSVIAVRTADLASKRPMLQALVDAIVEASALQRTDREASEAVLARWLQVDDPAALDEAWTFYAQKIVPAVPRVEPAQLEAARAILAADNARIASYDAARLIDNSLVDDAAARGIGATKSAQ